MALGKKCYLEYRKDLFQTFAFKHISMLFLYMSDTDFASYADDNAPYVSADTIDEVIERLETASGKLFKWFTDNRMKANQDKYHLIISKNENV